MDSALLQSVHEIVSRIVSYRYKRSIVGAEYQDFYQEGMLAALKILPNYDPALSKLNTFLSIRVNGAISDLMRTLDPITRNARNKLKDIRQKQEEHAVRHSEVLPLNNIPGIEEASSALIQHFDINKPCGEGLTLEGFVSGDSLNPEDVHFNSSVMESLFCALEKLPAKSRNCVLMWFQGMNLREVGSLYGVSESRISQIITGALPKIRGSLNKGVSYVVQTGL